MSGWKERLLRVRWLEWLVTLFGLEPRLEAKKLSTDYSHRCE